MNRTICFLLVVLFAIAGTATAAWRGPQPASAQRPTAQIAPKPPLKPLESVLNRDGTLNLASGYTGSLDTKGWRMVSAAGEKPRFVPDAPEAPYAAGDENWDRRFGAPGVSYAPNAIAVMGSDVYVGGSYFTTGELIVNGIARWDSIAGRWHTLGAGSDNGVDGSVDAIAIRGADVYIGGHFGMAGGAPAHNIAKWDAATQQWQSLGDGLGGASNPNVHAIEISGSDVYVGGNFTTAGGLAANRVARWDAAAQQWSPLGVGVTGGYVNDIVVIGSQVFVGGSFTSAGGTPANNIARWDASAQQWSPLGSGLSGRAFALEAIGTDLYVGGRFGIAGETVANNIARWDSVSQQWHAVALNSGAGMDYAVYDMAAIGSDLYVGGEFRMAWTTPANYIARWDSVARQWHALGNGSSEGVVGGEVRTLGAGSNAVYVGGWFGAAGDVGANRIAGWDVANSRWFPLNDRAGSSNGAGNDVYAIAVSGTDVYVGGYFHTIGDIVANYIARWDSLNNRWSSLGSGVGDSYDPAVNAIAVIGSNVYVGGGFGRAGNQTAHNIARWDTITQQWHSLGNDYGVNGGVSALAVSGSDLYVGGSFGGAGGTSAHHIARWDTINNQWHSLGSGASNGVNDPVYAIAVIGSDVYAGGHFTVAGATSVNHIARWDSVAQEWHSLGSGVGGVDYPYVWSLATIGSDLYAGGKFHLAGGVAVNKIAKWNPATQQWSALGDGVSSSLEPSVNELRARGTDLYVGGRFSVAGAVGANNIAIWDAVQEIWRPLGNGVRYGGVSAIAHTGNNVYLGGYFDQAGDKVSSNFAIYHLPCPMAFADVRPSDYFHAAVSYLYCSGAVSGYEDNTFRPYNNTTRAQLCKIVALAEGWPLENPAQPHFSDVPRNHPFFTYVETAYAQGVIAGYADGSFRARYDVTRAQLAKIITLSEGWELVTLATPTFNDVPIGNPFYSYVETAYANGVITGYADGTFRPVNSATRGQISKIVYQAVTQP